MNVIAPDIGKCVTDEKISGGNLLPSLGGTGKIFADQDDFFLKKFPFSRQKSLMTFF